jgi:cellulose synthase/poly-beta-1,6-N-acetylglucosamine synthase-like glycosyltransferase
MKISMITTLYNEGENILAFLKSYGLLTKLPDEFIIVDGGSNDGTIDLIKKFSDEHKSLNIKLIVDETCSKKYSVSPVAKGRNVAIRNANYDIIAVTDAGCILTDNWLEEIVKPFTINKDIDVVMGKNKFFIKNDFQKRYEPYALHENVYQPSSRNLAFKRSMWKKVNGYPETSLTAEDTLFNINLKKANAKFYFNPRAIIKWEGPKNLLELKQKQIGYGRGDGFNRIDLLKFIIRIPLMFLPVNLLFKKGIFNGGFKIAYLHMFFYQIGYIKGLLYGRS